MREVASVAHDAVAIVIEVAASGGLVPVVQRVIVRTWLAGHTILIRRIVLLWCSVRSLLLLLLLLLGDCGIGYLLGHAHRLGWG